MHSGLVPSNVQRQTELNWKSSKFATRFTLSLWIVVYDKPVSYMLRLF